MDARIDVLVPHFNDPEGLARTLSSVAAQTWSAGFRVVLVDDGSPQQQAEAACRVLQSSTLDHHFERNKENRGRPFTRNRLLAAIDSPYVTWLDTGDVWHPEKTSAQMAVLRTLEHDESVDVDKVWITCDFDCRWANGRHFIGEQKLEGDQLRSLMEAHSLRAYLWTLLATRTAMTTLGQFDSRLTRLQDLDFFLRFVGAGGRLYKPPGDEANPLCLYVKSDAGRNARQIHDCNQYLIEKHAVLYRSYGKDFEARRRAQASLLAFRFALNNRNPWLCARYVAEALGRNPTFATKFLLSKMLERGALRI